MYSLETTGTHASRFTVQLTRAENGHPLCFFFYEEPFELADIGLTQHLLMHSTGMHQFSRYRSTDARTVANCRTCAVLGLQPYATKSIFFDESRRQIIVS